MSEPFSFMPRVTRWQPNPTVQVAINGLAICCFSKQFDRAETGFLEIRNHPLLFTIYNKDCRAVYKTPIEVHSGTTIKINHNNPGLGGIYTPDTGDIPNDSDDRDFRHLISIDRIHKEIFPNPERVELKPNTYLAKLYLSNGTFFTHKRSVNRGKIVNAKLGDPPISKDLPRVGRLIGANIFDREVFVEVSSGTIPIPPLKSTDPGAPYLIVIRYKCERVRSKKTDFDKFYKVLGLPSGHKKLDLEFGGVEPVEPLDCEKRFAEFIESEGFDKDTERGKMLSKLLKNLRRAEEACQAAVKPACPTNLQGIDEPCS